MIKKPCTAILVWVIEHSCTSILAGLIKGLVLLFWRGMGRLKALYFYLGGGGGGFIKREGGWLGVCVQSKVVS